MQINDANLVVLHPNLKHKAVTVAAGGWEIREVDSDETVYSDFGSGSSITSLAFSGNGHFLMVAAQAGDVQIFDTSGLDGSGGNVEAEPVEPLRVLKVPGQRSFIMASGAISSDGNKVAVASSNNRVVVVWDLPSGAETEFKAQRVTGLAFSPDGARLAAVLRSGSVLVWDLRDNGRREVKGGQRSELSGAAVSPDGEQPALPQLEGHKSAMSAEASTQESRLHVPGSAGSDPPESVQGRAAVGLAPSGGGSSSSPGAASGSAASGGAGEGVERSGGGRGATTTSAADATKMAALLICLQHAELKVVNLSRQLAGNIDAADRWAQQMLAALTQKPEVMKRLRRAAYPALRKVVRDELRLLGNEDLTAAEELALDKAILRMERQWLDDDNQLLEAQNQQQALELERLRACLWQALEEKDALLPPLLAMPA